MGHIVVAALIFTAAPDTRRIEDPRGFSFDLPADAVELSGSKKVAPEVRVGSLGTWVRKLDSEEFVLVSIDGMPGTLGREPINLGEFGPRGATAFKEKWKSFEVDGMRMIEAREGQRILVLAVQVPMAPNALQVMTSGLEANEPAVKNAMRLVLNSLEGKSSWLTDEERVAAGVEGAVRLAITFLALATVGFGGWRLLRKRRAR